VEDGRKRFVLSVEDNGGMEMGISDYGGTKRMI